MESEPGSSAAQAGGHLDSRWERGGGQRVCVGETALPPGRGSCTLCLAESLWAAEPVVPQCHLCGEHRARCLSVPGATQSLGWRVPAPGGALGTHQERPRGRQMHGNLALIQDSGVPSSPSPLPALPRVTDGSRRLPFLGGPLCAPCPPLEGLILLVLKSRTSQAPRKCWGSRGPEEGGSPGKAELGSLPLCGLQGLRFSKEQRQSVL